MLSCMCRNPLKKTNLYLAKFLEEPVKEIGQSTLELAGTSEMHQGVSQLLSRKGYTSPDSSRVFFA